MNSGRVPLLTAQEITKAFGATRALRGVSLALQAGEVHALAGQNGAGKSTLVKILAGAVRADSGVLMLNGGPVVLSNVRDAVERGIVPIYQQLSLMPHLSVGENLRAFQLAGGAAWSAVAGAPWVGGVRTVLSQLGLQLDLRVPVGELSPAERQLVEIARGVIRDCTILILDEPTASLNRAEVARLFGVIRSLREQGRAVLFISHRLDEIEEIADRVSVLRDGEMVLEGVQRAGVSGRDIVQAMVGRALDQEGLVLPEPDGEVLRAERLTAPGAFTDVSLTLRRGEIVGIVGLIGSGALQVGAALAGAFRVRSGRLSLDGSPIPTDDRVSALRAGIGFLPADREQEGVFPTLSVLANSSASVLHELGRLGWLRAATERDWFLPRLRRLAVTPEDPDANIRTLSGGNQQKVLVVRNLASARARVIVALEPSRGVDIGVRGEIRRALVEAARANLGVVLVSSDLEEVLTISHRLVVMRGGRVVAEVGGRADPTRVLALLTGALA